MLSDMELNEKSLKTILKEQREEFQRYLSVVSESSQLQVKLIAESLSGIQEQLVGIREMVAKNTEDIEIMKSDIGFIKGSLKKKVDYDEFIALERRMTLMESKVRR